VPIRFRCVKCSIELSGDGASRHYLDEPGHKLEKIPALKKPFATQIN